MVAEILKAFLTEHPTAGTKQMAKLTEYLKVLAKPMESRTALAMATDSEKVNQMGITTVLVMMKACQMALTKVLVMPKASRMDSPKVLEMHLGRQTERPKVLAKPMESQMA